MIYYILLYNNIFISSNIIGPTLIQLYVNISHDGYLEAITNYNNASEVKQFSIFNGW